MKKANREIKKLFIGNIIMIIVPALVIFVIMLVMVYNLSAEKNIDRITFEANETTAHRLVLADKVFSDVDSQTEELLKSSSAQKFFAIEDLYNDMTEFRIMVTEIYRISDSMLSSSSLASFIAVYADKSDYSLCRSVDGEYIRGISDELKKNGEYHMYRRDKVNDIDYLIVAKGVYDDTNYMGTVVCGIYYDDLMQYLDAKQPNLLGMKFTDELGYVVIDTVNENLDNYDYIKTEEISESAGKMECYTDINDEIKITNVFTPGVASVILLAFLLLAMLTAVGCLKIYVPFERAMKIMNEEEATERSHEYEKIIGNNIKERSHKYFRARRIDKSLETMNKMQMVALQSQINPHFLSNALQIIGLYAEKLGDNGEKVAEMLVKLSQILRYSFSTKTHTIALREEIEYLKMYVDIQKEREFSTFACVIEIPENMMDIKIPKVTFQPIVENAVRYCRLTGGNVYIRGYTKGENIYFEIINDGPPIEKKLADELNCKFLKNEFPEDTQIGLNNVNQRLRLIYGDGYGLKISYDEKGRTKVRVKITSD